MDYILNYVDFRSCWDCILDITPDTFAESIVVYELNSGIMTAFPCHTWISGVVTLSPGPPKTLTPVFWELG